MENSIQLQLIQASVFFSAGIAVGLVYDMCRAVRRCSGALVRKMTDVLFVCAAAALLYVLGMGWGEGQLRIFMVACLCLGMMGYSALCSGVTVPVFCKGIKAIQRGIGIAAEPFGRIKFFIKNRKNLFPKRNVWSKMNGYSFNMRQFVFSRTRGEEGRKNNRETHQTGDLYCAGCADNIRRVEYRSSTDSCDTGRK